MKSGGRGSMLVGILLSGVLLAAGAVRVDASCCDTATGCSNASETGCLMGSAGNMFFASPCECDAGVCNNNGASCASVGGGECGDGNIDGGEDCDAGALNGTFESCCASDCTFRADGSLCDDGVFCDGIGECNATGTCEANEEPACPDPTMCVEDTRSCGQQGTPTMSFGVLGGLATAMLAGASVVLARRRRS